MKTEEIQALKAHLDSMTASRSSANGEGEEEEEEKKKKEKIAEEMRQMRRRFDQEVEKYFEKITKLQTENDICEAKAVDSIMELHKVNGEFALARRKIELLEVCCCCCCCCFATSTS